MKYTKTTGIFIILIWIAIFIYGMLCSSCRSQRVVTVPEYHEVVTHQRDTVSTVDSIYVKDSVLVIQRHDTIFITRTRTEFRDRWRDRLRVDSFIQRDSIPVRVEVEKQLTRWQKLSMRTGKVVLLLMLLAVAGGFLYLLLRHRFRL